MSWLSTLFGNGTAKTLDAASGLVKSLYTSPGNKLGQEEELQKTQNVALEKQQEIDKTQINANSLRKDPIWKSAIAWVCVGGIFYDILARPLIMGFTSYILPDIQISELIMLISGMLGMSTLHLIDKLKNR